MIGYSNKTAEDESVRSAQNYTLPDSLVIVAFILHNNYLSRNETECALNRSKNRTCPIVP